MANEPGKPQEETPAPSRKVRLAWWFGIYVAAATFLPVFVIRGMSFKSVLYVLLAPLYWSLIFPIGFVGLIDFLPHGALSDDPTRGGATAALVVIPLVAYATYITHLVYTLKAKTRRRFRLLLLGLVIIVSTNIVGCYGILTEDPKPAVFHPAQSQK